MRKMIAGILVLVACNSVVAPQVKANDGGISYGGTPGLLKAHPSVAMKSEVVRIVIDKEHVKVDCRFVFQNYGAPCQVRMGFPDEGYGDSPGAEQGENEKPKSNFNCFKSSIDGVPVATSLVTGESVDGSALKWQTKNVRFGRNQRRIVRDIYTVDIGGQIARQGFYSTAAYTLHTGASWRGNIERSEVIVSFGNTLKGRLVPIPLASPGNFDGDSHFKWADYERGTILYKGPSRPIVRGRTLRFVRANWQPTIRDDVFLIFNHRSESEMVAHEKLPYFSYPTTRLLSKQELKDFNAPQLRLIRNSIYARRGRPFADKELARFFGEQSWYHPRASWKADDDDKRLSAIDKKNVESLLMLEKS